MRVGNNTLSIIHCTFPCMYTVPQVKACCLPDIVSGIILFDPHNVSSPTLEGSARPPFHPLRNIQEVSAVMLWALCWHWLHSRQCPLPSYSKIRWPVTVIMMKKNNELLQKSIEQSSQSNTVHQLTFSSKLCPWENTNFPLSRKDVQWEESKRK